MPSYSSAQIQSLHAAESPESVSADVSWPQNVSHSPEMKIGQVVDFLKLEFPALSMSKVRYLEGEGLVCPQRMGNGYRRYSKADVERLRFILTAQRDEYLPLGIIRDRLYALDAGEEDADPAPIARVVAASGELVDTEATVLSLEELSDRSGASLEDIEQLVTLGLVAPDARGNYSAYSLKVVSLAAAANQLGVPMRNLRAVRMSADRQADTVEQTVSPKLFRSNVAAQEAAVELTEIVAQLHTVLLRHAVEVSF